MNSDIVRWLLDVNVIPKGSEALHLAWERPWPAWVWAIIVMTAALFAIWSYSRLAGRRLGRGILSAARFAIIMLVLILISGPMLELPRETVEQDWVIMLADRSASMTIADAAKPSAATSPSLSQRVSRDEQLRLALSSQRDVLRTLAEQRHVAWMGFHYGAYTLENASETDEQSRSDLPIALGEPDGQRTNLDAALEQALQRAAARPVSGVVLFSDGRTDTPYSRALLRRLQADSIPVFVMPLGSSEPLGDLAIRRVDAPRRAFVRDKVPVVVELDRLGAAGANLGGAVKLIDDATGEELDRVDLQPGDENQQITLTAEPMLAGEATWRVVIETAEPDLIPDNNLRPFQIDLIDRPLRVLFVEGYPRWEYRYVKNLLVREQSIDSSVMLISADRDFAQEGNQPISRLPRTPEEFAAFDVIVLGDVPASFFSPEQLEMIRAHVADRGAGLLWIAGERSTPHSYASTALSDLLPMRGPLNLPPVGEAVTMQPTQLAQRLGVLHLAAGQQVGWPEELSDMQTGWSRLHYAQRIDPAQLKPATEVLAETTTEFAGSRLPLVMSMRYGAGQSIYVATDEIWRWRYGRGELYPDQFWVQMIRLLGRESLTAGSDPATLEVNPRRVAINQPIRIELRLLDAQLTQEQQSTARVVLVDENGQRVAELELQRVPGSEDRFAGTYLPDAPGSLRVLTDDATLAQLNLQAPVEIFLPDDELRRPETDHELLHSLAAATGGRVLQPGELHLLLDPNVMRRREIRTYNPITEPIWDSPLAFALALLVLTFEWIGRKVLRLV